MKIIGLTGGTGSGKSTVARRFEEHQIPIIDADRLGHDMIAPGGAAEQAVMEAFGPDILTSGIIDRAKLGAVVFKDPDKLKQLNALVHPPLLAQLIQLCQLYAARGEAFVIIDAALLGEWGEKDPWIDKLILVSAPVETRIERLVEGRGIDREEALRRVRAQADPERKRAYSHWVIENTGDMESLRGQVTHIMEHLLDGESGTS